MDDQPRDDALQALGELRKLDEARYEREIATITACELRRVQAEAARDGFSGATGLLVEAMAALREAGAAEVAADIDVRLQAVIERAIAVLGHPGLKH